jgi:hypothetical protein
MLTHHRDNYLCYEYAESIKNCKDKYSSFCPRICSLFDKEQGESQGIERLFSLKELQNGKSKL